MTKKIIAGSVVKRIDGFLNDREATVERTGVTFKIKGKGIIGGFIKIRFNDNPSIPFIYPEEAFELV